MRSTPILSNVHQEMPSVAVVPAMTYRTVLGSVVDILGTADVVGSVVNITIAADVIGSVVDIVFIPS